MYCAPPLCLASSCFAVYHTNCPKKAADRFLLGGRIVLVCVITNSTALNRFVVK